MNQRSLRELLHDAMPTPPLELRTPPLAGIRRRAHRRRLAAGLGTAAVVLVLAMLGVQVIRAGQAAEPFMPAATQSATRSSGPWTFAVVSTDERTVVVVKEGPGAIELCPGALPIDPLPSSGPIHVLSDRVVLPIPATLPGCAYRMTFQLDAPLGTRSVIDWFSGAALTVLHERVLPRPTYPNGISVDTTSSNVVGNAARPAWVVLYSLLDGFTITVTAVPADMAPSLQVQEQLSFHGRNMQVLKPLMGGEGIVVWIEEGWQISLTVDPAEHRPLSRDELLRVIDNLVWP